MRMMLSLFVLVGLHSSCGVDGVRTWGDGGAFDAGEVFEKQRGEL